MNCWEILSIMPTTDEREIRRAYAKKLKITRPDEAPHAYQILREAFENALQLAPYYQETEQDEVIFEESTAEREDDVSNELPDISKSEIQPYEPENTEDLSNEHFDMSDNDDVYNAPIYPEADALLNEIRRIITTEGEIELEKQWRNLYFEMNQLPLEQTDYISWQVWLLFQDVKIKNPFVWAQWSGHFSWHNDYRFAQFCNLDDLTYAQEKIQLAETLNQISMDNALESDSTPILTAISDRLSNGKNYLLTQCYLMLISPFVKTEEYKNQYKYNRAISLTPQLDNLLSLTKIYRLFFFIGVIILSYPLFKDKIIKISTSNFLAFIAFFFAFNFIVMRFFVPIAITAKSLFASSLLNITKGKAIIESLLPLIFIILLSIITPENIYSERFFLLLWIIIAWSMSTFYMLEDANLWHSYFIPLFIGILVILELNVEVSKNIYIILPLLILWIHINLYIVNFNFNWISKLQNINDYICQERELPSGKDILKMPFYALSILIYWIFFLPFHVARLYSQIRTIFVFIEIIIVASIFTIFITHFFINNAITTWLTFFVALYFVVVIQFKIKDWVFKRLNIQKN